MLRLESYFSVRGSFWSFVWRRALNL